MADAKKEKPAKAAKKSAEKEPRKKGLPLPLLILGAIAGVILLPVTVILIAGLVPSIVTYLTDRNPKRNLTVGLGALNLASALYVVFQLVHRGPTLEYAVQLLMQPFNFLIMWGGAALGVLLHKVIPAIVAQALAGFAEIKAQKLRENQKELKKIWGDGVGG